MSQPTPPDAWKTAAIREAESALDRSVSKSRQLLKDLEKLQLPPVERTASPEKIAALQAAAARPDAPPQLRLLKRKVDAGELSWEDVASGKAFADPEVRALAMGRLGEAHEMYEEIREGATPDEVLEARTGGRPADPLADTGRSPYAAGPAAPAGYSPDDPLASGRAPEPPADPGRPGGPSGRWSTEPQSEPPARPEPEPPARHRREPEWEDDDFADPLAEDTAPPPSAPERRTRRDSPADDDYFGGSFLS
ncbi:hypothetical protein GCM10027258_30470 [Amycolatopsis stemonae]